MTVSTTATKITAEGNGATTAWPFTFAVQDDDEIVVTLTDSSGTVTTLPSSAYSITLNSATGTNPTPVGGTVTYPLSGPALALGNFLTVQRLAPYTQPTSLANQGISWQSTIEAALDNVVFQTQQINFQIGQQFSVPVSDDPPAVLPTAALRANLWAYFDASGNMTAAAAPSGSVAVSAAMIPVVGAATLALARTAFGLGAIATEGIGAGLQDDGASSVRAYLKHVNDAISVAVVATFHLNDRYATGALTYTCPATSTLFSGFGFYVTALTAAVTFAIDAGDAFVGGSTGVSMVIPPGTQVYISTNGSGTWYIREVQAIGLNSALNLQINASVAANALTISLKDRNGNDPTTASPSLLAFRDPTAANGGPILRALTSGLSLVIPNGAEFGTADAIPFRIWVLAFDNAGTIVVGAVQTVVGGAAPTAIGAIDESLPTTGTAISTGADSGNTIYTASSVTTKSFRILGYLDFSTGQASKGVWATAPDRIQLFGPGIKLPGDTINRRYATDSTASTNSTSPFVVSNTAVSITLKSAANIVVVRAAGSATAAAGTGAFQLGRDSNSHMFGGKAIIANASSIEDVALEGWDRPGDTSSHSYGVYIGNTGANATVWSAISTTQSISTISAEEVMV